MNQYKCIHIPLEETIFVGNTIATTKIIIYQRTRFGQFALCQDCHRHFIKVYDKLEAVAETTKE